jgi:hypothetical protein
MNSTNDQQTLQAIVQKAWTDSAFKQNLIEQPVSTIEGFLGHSLNLPQGKSLSIVDQSNSSTIFINIPAKPDMEDMELDEEQLDIVSGGGDGDPPPPTVQGIIVNNNGNLFGGV